jgi:capsular exopolysaccharide synthesis family protein
VGLAGGLILGIAVVLLLEQFDTRVRTADEVAAIFGMPIIGNLHKVSSNEIESQPLVVLSDSRSSAAEAIRKLRGNLEFTNVDGDLKSLFITSALQHEGKSLAAANLALSLAATGVRVVLVDADLRRPQIHVYLNLPNGSGLSTVLTGKSDLRETIHSRSVGPGRIKIRESDTADGPPNGGERLYVLTSGPVPPNPAEMIASRSFSSVMTELRADFDLIVVDAPSVLAVGDPAAIARCVDGLVFLVDLTRAVRPLLKDAASQIEHMPCRKLGLVIVARAQRHDSYSYYAQGQSPLDVGSGKLSRLKRVRI